MKLAQYRTHLARFACVLVVATPAATSRPAGAQVAQSAPAARATQSLPERLTAAEFWKLVNDISEPGGYFRIEDNYTSNEREVGELFTMLRDRKVSGDVYMGVGPEQNFSYIASIRPKMAFIVDIRRQAVMQHLMFKAMFEMAKDRAEFVSLLFSRPRPAGLDTLSGIAQIWSVFSSVARDSTLAAANYTRVVDRLTKTHGFTFTADESIKLKAVTDAFTYFGPAISTRGSTGGGRAGGTFVDMTAGSFDSSGQPRSFLTSEENYRYVKTMHEKNLIVPVSGDFGGDKAIRAIGTYLKERGGVVRAFYVSNVEQYLIQDGKARAFYDNVATLPADSASVFIRPYSMRRGTIGPSVALCPILANLRGTASIYTYNDVLVCPKG